LLKVNINFKKPSPCGSEKGQRQHGLRLYPENATSCSFLEKYDFATPATPATNRYTADN